MVGTAFYALLSNYEFRDLDGTSAFKIFLGSELLPCCKFHLSENTGRNSFFDFRIFLEYSMTGHDFCCLGDSKIAESGLGKSGCYITLLSEMSFEASIRNFIVENTDFHWFCMSRTGGILAITCLLTHLLNYHLFCLLFVASRSARSASLSAAGMSRSMVLVADGGSSDSELTMHNNTPNGRAVDSRSSSVANGKMVIKRIPLTIAAEFSTNDDNTSISNRHRTGGTNWLSLGLIQGFGSDLLNFGIES